MMLWKNQLGSTRQIDIFPQQADFAKEDFLWRLSSAEMKSDTEFSIFEKYDRLLTVLGLGSLQVQQTIIDQNHILRFRGDQTSFCKVLSENPVVDLGLIYHREKIKAQMRFQKLRFPQDDLVTSADVTYILCDSESLQLNNYHFEKMDCLVIEKSSHLISQSTQEARLILIEIFKV